jgi:hypothetical protein
MKSVIFLLFSSSMSSMLGGTIQEPWIQKVNSGFLSTESTKTPTLALVCSCLLMLGFLLSDLLKESPNKLFIFMVPDFYLQALSSLKMKTAEK